MVVSERENEKKENCYDEFLTALTTFGAEIPSGVCVEVITNNAYPNEVFVITIV
jgi:hypothetical protein